LGYLRVGSAEATSALLGDSDPSLVRSLLPDKVLIEKRVVVPQHISDLAVAAFGASWASDQLAGKVVVLLDFSLRVRIVHGAVDGFLGCADLAIGDRAVAASD